MFFDWLILNILSEKKKIYSFIILLRNNYKILILLEFIYKKFDLISFLLVINNFTNTEKKDIFYLWNV